MEIRILSFSNAFCLHACFLPPALKLKLEPVSVGNIPHFMEAGRRVLAILG